MTHQHYAENYVIDCLAGDGGQGQAYLCHSHGQFYIIKIYHSLVRGLQFYTKEVDIMRRIDSPHIVRMIEHYDEGRIRLHEQQERMPFIVLEFAEHGQLFKIVNQAKLHPDVCRTLFKQLISALKHLSELEIAHRDIKLENILLDANFNIKLADFGYACNSRGQMNDFSLRSYQGTPGYIAPQIINHTYQGQKIDMFAAGVVLFLMYVRIPPFQSTYQTDPRYNLIRSQRYEQFWTLFQRRGRFPNEFKRLINALLSLDPERRPTFAQLQVDLWMEGPILSNEQLITYFQPRYQRLAMRDPSTLTIRSQFGQNLQRLIQQRQNPERERSRDNRNNGNIRNSQESRNNEEASSSESTINNQPNNSSESSGNNEDSADNSHRSQKQLKNGEFQDILSLDIHPSTLPLQNIFKAVYVKANPKLILCWLRHFLNESQRKKQIFLPQNEWEIQPKQFSMSFTKEGKIYLNLGFQMNGNKDITQTSLQINGQMVRWQESIGISWQGKTGHTFWLSGIISELTSKMQFFFN